MLVPLLLVLRNAQNKRYLRDGHGLSLAVCKRVARGRLRRMDAVPALSAPAFHRCRLQRMDPTIQHACLTVIVVTCNFFSEFCQRRIATGCGGARRSPATGMRTPGASAWQGGMRTPVTQLSRPRGLESATN